MGGGSNDDGHSARQTTDGGYILLGETDSTAPGVNLQAYLIKTDADGNEMWSKTFGSVSKFDSGSSVWQTTDGGYIFSGYTSALPLAGNSDVYLVKTDANGNEMWSKVFGGSDSDRGFSVQQTTDDGYIIAGITGGKGNIWHDPYFDVYIIKTDVNGNQQWSKTFGGSEHDSGYSVQQTTDGGYIIAGKTESFGAGNYDVYLIYYKPDDIVIENQTLNSIQSFAACETITAGPAVNVTPTGDVNFQAGAKVSLGSGFSVEDGGRLSVVVDPSTCP